MYDHLIGSQRLTKRERTFLEEYEKAVPWIANTHEHFDHTANNCYFDLVFLTEKAHERATTPFKSFQGIDFPKDYPAQSNP